MINLLNYPFDAQLILKKKKSIKTALLKQETFIDKKIAILGGSTTHEIKECLELFSLAQGIRPKFYETEFGQFWQAAMFHNPEMEEFAPDIIYIHTSNCNISTYPTMKDSADSINNMLSDEYTRFELMWKKLIEQYNCPIIQNNFEMPFYRLLGNKDASDIHGRINYISRLNSLFYEFAQNNNNFFINDINYLSASYGLEKWSDLFYWHMYKYSLCMSAIPNLAFNVSNIIKSIFGKNKKALVLDLDNTLWGGVVGDDGVEGIEIGHETSMGQIYSEFQQYLMAHKDLGVMLNINSKNDYDNAIAGLNHPEGTLKPEDFIVIKANWQNKDMNIREIASELNILESSLVFIDDNPFEREIVKVQIESVAVPDIGNVENYINVIDKSGFFEVTTFTDDDIKRNEMYKANMERAKQQQGFGSYEDYLKSQDMTATIKDFDSVYIQRITQLTNKSNQFNLTTKRYTQSEMEEVFTDNSYIRLYGKLKDKFGDNGVVTVVVGRKENHLLCIDLWLMSCRVLKRGLEEAMLDRFVEEAKLCGITTLIGYYYKTEKNSMVKDFYDKFGFKKIREENEDTVWELDISKYQNKNNIIKVVK